VPRYAKELRLELVPILDRDISDLNFCDSDDAAKYARQVMGFPPNEQFFILALDCGYEYIGEKIVNIGLSSQVQVDAVSIIRAGLFCGAVAMILFHNHPSGVALPSNADIMMTLRLIKICQLHDIEILDHIILGDDEYFSMAAEKKTQNMFPKTHAISEVIERFKL
jgi:DNA repair protein RadC